MKTIAINEDFILEVENYGGSTIQGFKLSVEDNEINIIDVFYKDCEYKSLESFGIDINFSDEGITISSNDYQFVDTDGDYLFDTSLDLIRFQQINED